MIVLVKIFEPLGKVSSSLPLLLFKKKQMVCFSSDIYTETA